MTIKEPYKPVTDPQERLIQIRGVRKLQGKPLEMRVPYSIQEFFAKMLNHLGHRSDWFASCITCNHWKEQQCDKFKCIPPAAVIADGCEYYEDNDQIPF